LLGGNAANEGDTGSVTLGDLAGKLTMLEISCSKCDRRGLLRLNRLIEEHGAGMGMPVLGSCWPATARAPGRSASATAAGSISHSCCRTSSCGSAAMTPKDERELDRGDSHWLYIALGVVGVIVWVVMREFGWL
jgi:hypothetical protein